MPNVKNPVVVVAGGTRGLGLKIAETFRRFEAAQIVLLGRDQERLDTAVGELKTVLADATESNPTGHAIDVTNGAAVKDVVQKIVSQHRRIDTWINAVGKSTRADFMSTGVSVYRELMEQNFFASLTCSLAVLPELEKTSGSLVNIGSLASKTAWPFVAPYVTGKHALAGFCDQLRLEGPSNVHYLHVCTGPIQRDGDQQRYASEAENLPEHANAPGAGAPVKGIHPEVLAKKIMVACNRRKPELVLPVRSRFLFSIQQLFPSIGDRFLRYLSRTNNIDKQ